ncbi:juvenile hormone esterase-like [Diabrotica undecimpunctata]|uniref:juvenile hormone esterase-like n=1 Tax=Diabrotica undecimpunctata TaxID=50387 RepID=UPI003B63D783
MKILLKNMIKSLVLLVGLALHVSCENPIVYLPNGQIRGRQVSAPAVENFKYYAFLGIPYAAPPVGKLRFQAPKPHSNWEGVFEATDNSKICIQVGLKHAHASEDCLYLNVYSPDLSPSQKLPVLIFIHGGTFRRGSAFAGYKAPAFLVKEGIVVVTINYRLGPFGFLTSQDNAMPGNYGLKDQHFALKWVQQNIHLFGGDPDQVTISGQSAGAASVAFHIMNLKSKGLFRAAIAHSGSALNNWAYQHNGRDIAYGIAAEIDPNFTRNKTTEELLEFLTNVPASDIEKTADKFSAFAPAIEVPSNDSVFANLIYDAATMKYFNKVPLLIGINSEEAVFKAKDLHSLKKEATGVDKDPSKLVTFEVLPYNDSMQSLVGNKIKDLYVGDQSFEENLGKYLQYFGDNRYMRPVIKFAELISTAASVYFYQFSYSGKLGGNDVSYPGIGKVAHGEDLNYLWVYHDDYTSFPDSDLIALKRYVQIVANFVKNLEPSISDETINWPLVQSGSISYLDIDEKLSINKNPREFSYAKWEDIFSNYARTPYLSY